jgi:hypothetical protein
MMRARNCGPAARDVDRSPAEIRVLVAHGEVLVVERRR